MPDLKFPREFLFGVATSAHQIEGATREGGRGECIWDRYSATPGKIEDASTAAVACDHYHRWEEDVRLLRELEVNAYRFSIAWPRILPTGTGKVNEAGLDFYDRLVDRLVEANIRPFVTLYHWDLPAALQDRGGWVNRETAEAFAHYATIVGNRLGDRVKDWVTVNEPWCIAVLGHAEGKHAPGHESWPEALAVSHHVLLGHGLATRALRAVSAGSRVGLTVNLVPSVPASPSAADREACRRFDGSFNRWYLDPLFGRGYPIDVVRDHVASGWLSSETLPFVQQGDMEIIAEPTDYLGVNYYSRGIIRSRDVPEHENAPREIPEPKKEELTDMGWEVWAPGLGDLLRHLHHTYAPRAIYVLENGAAYADAPGPYGRVHDDRRVRYLEQHLEEAARSIADGVPLRGYFHWSLMDNFEWGHGYTKRFGLVFVDYATQRRVVKDSGHVYRDLIRRARC